MTVKQQAMRLGIVNNGPQCGFRIVILDNNLAAVTCTDRGFQAADDEGRRALMRNIARDTLRLNAMIITGDWETGDSAQYVNVRYLTAEELESQIRQVQDRRRQLVTNQPEGWLTEYTQLGPEEAELTRQQMTAASRESEGDQR